MKKILSLLCGSLIVLLLFGAPGNVALAQDEHECGCDVEQLQGAEKNKIVSNLLKSEEFKNVKKKYMQNGFKWNGVSKVEVLKNHTHGGMIMVGAPFYSPDGTVTMAVFFNGVYMDPDLLKGEAEEAPSVQ
ncbi:MAG: hypothetical protein K0Q87_1855 [Neobacillus sp.]|jgi:hypothetical protein|nr:hypothetical protein [Neobacillus sp.]